MKKYFLFSDSHGNFDALISSLIEASFDINDENHILVGLGDYFDRGHQSAEILMLLVELCSRKRFLGIKGNHEDFLEYFLEEGELTHNLYLNGFFKTLESFAKMKVITTESDSKCILERINKRFPFLKSFLGSLKEYILINETILLTHGGLSYSPVKRDWYIFNFSDTISFIEGYKKNDYTFIFGHFHTRILNEYFLNKKNDDSIFRYKNFIGLDACTVRSNRVNIYIIEQK